MTAFPLFSETFAGWRSNIVASQTPTVTSSRNIPANGARSRNDKFDGSEYCYCHVCAYIIIEQCVLHHN